MRLEGGEGEQVSDLYPGCEVLGVSADLQPVEEWKMAELQMLLEEEIPSGKRALIESYQNLTGWQTTVRTPTYRLQIREKL